MVRFFAHHSRTSSLALLLVTVAPMDAQSHLAMSKVGVGPVALHLSASVSVPVRLKARQLGEALVIGRTADFTEVEILVQAAANLAWSLAIGASDESVDRCNIHVLDAYGNWIPLCDGASAITVVEQREPTNPQVFRVRLRLSDGASVAQIRSVRLLLRPADASR